jgi:cation:H+ antiporter
MIYFSAATAYRRKHKRPMRVIRLDEEQAVQILGLLVGVAYQAAIWWKGSLNVFDGAVLLAIYVGYLWIMRRLPPEEQETLDEISGVPRSIVLAPKPVRIGAILGLFIVGGAAVFLVAEPFLAGLFGLSLLVGVAPFQFVQWIAPLVSETPEGISAFYWARDPERASIALMNLVSSNINQWTLLAALLPMVLSISAGHVSSIPLDAVQSRYLALTLAQSLLGATLLLNMELAWWEALGIFVLFAIQLWYSVGAAGERVHLYITWIYLVWCAVEALRMIGGKRKAAALRHFRDILSTHSR